MSDAYAFDVFISYCHADEAQSIQFEQALRRYRAPWRSGLQPSRLKVFRDASDGAATQLGEGLAQALNLSRRLLVLCSPRARDRPWINWEIEQFAKLRGLRSIVPVLIDGLPNKQAAEKGQPDQAAFPPALLDAGTEEPWAPDFRDLNRSARGPRAIPSAWYHVLAAIYGTTREIIEQREQQRRRRAIALGALSLAAVSAGGVQLYASNQRSRSMQLAEEVRKAPAGESQDRDRLLKAIAAAETWETPQAVESLHNVLLRLHPAAETWAGTDALVAPSGTQLLLGREPGAVRLLDVATSKVTPLCGHFGTLTKKSYTPDGAYLIAADETSTLHLWSARTGQLVAQARIESRVNDKAVLIGVDEFEFDPTGRYMLTKYRSYQPVLWKVPGLQVVLQPEHAVPTLFHPTLPIAVSFPVVNDMPRITTWRLSDGEVVSQSGPPGDPTTPNFKWVRLTGDGSRLVGGIPGKGGVEHFVREVPIDASGALGKPIDKAPNAVDFSTLFQKGNRDFWGYHITDVLRDALAMSGREDVLNIAKWGGRVSPSGQFGMAPIDTAASPVVYEPRTMKSIGTLTGWSGKFEEAYFDEPTGRAMVVTHHERPGNPQREYTESWKAVTGWDLRRREKLWGPLPVTPYESVGETRIQVRLSADGRRLLVAPDCRFTDRSSPSRAPDCAAHVFNTADGSLASTLIHEAPNRFEGLGIHAPMKVVYFSESGDRLFTALGSYVYIWEVVPPMRRLRIDPHADWAQERRSVRHRLDSNREVSALLAIAKQRLNNCPR